MAANLRQRLGTGPLLLLTDYDGTLSELSPTPEQAVLATDVRQEMDRVAALAGVTFGVVSGRRMADVMDRVGPAAAFGAVSVIAFGVVLLEGWVLTRRANKKKGKTLPLTDFLKPASVGRWADEDVENDTRESPSRHQYRTFLERYCTHIPK